MAPAALTVWPPDYTLAAREQNLATDCGGGGGGGDVDESRRVCGRRVAATQRDK